MVKMAIVCAYVGMEKSLEYQVTIVRFLMNILIPAANRVYYMNSFIYIVNTSSTCKHIRIYLFKLNYELKHN